MVDGPADQTGACSERDRTDHLHHTQAQTAHTTHSTHSTHSTGHRHRHRHRHTPHVTDARDGSPNPLQHVGCSTTETQKVTQKHSKRLKKTQNTAQNAMVVHGTATAVGAHIDSTADPAVDQNLAAESRIEAQT